jgi:hypothetical protein
MIPLPKLLVEYVGTLLILSTLFFTHGNPILVPIAHMTALFFGKGLIESHYNPLYLLLEYSLGRVMLPDALTSLAVQLSAVLSVLVLNYSVLPSRD